MPQRHRITLLQRLGEWQPGWAWIIYVEVRLPTDGTLAFKKAAANYMTTVTIISNPVILNSANSTLISVYIQPHAATRRELLAAVAVIELVRKLSLTFRVWHKIVTDPGTKSFTPFPCMCTWPHPKLTKNLVWLKSAQHSSAFIWGNSNSGSSRQITRTIIISNQHSKVLWQWHFAHRT